MKTIHRIVELYDGSFGLERYEPWYLFWFEMPQWKKYLRYSYDVGTVSCYDPISFPTLKEALSWLSSRYNCDVYLYDGDKIGLCNEIKFFNN